MRQIKKIHKAIHAPMGDLVTYRALPTSSVEYIDPFLFLNHHGPQVYRPNNQGLPFGPHPHRGFETLTFIVDGDITHQDTGGGKDVIEAGGVQWMTAGSGLIHAEVSSEKFKKEGGPLEILQLWFNLPAKYKMVKPTYIGLQKDNIPVVKEDEGKVKVNVISGTWASTRGPIPSLSDIHMASIEMQQGGSFTTSIDEERNIFFYVVRGAVNVNGENIGKLHLVEFENEGEEIRVEATEDSYILLGHAKPFNEPVVAHGPFVMNTEEEIREAFRDYQLGKMGSWE
ncbi:redox-sensitive bicupin YhaK (pirin superfamily) [Pontibacter aydingkolensis]|uniref:Pirin family protein n=1 Tax=Pontibacter aydingkolensis TaxID=1911536 RepID=A0ABS7CZH5_9BACT|nr:pirin family protein [Pontibacter aydingkolensis]MBW7469263.1 pirin family protein [Pontibacter aydingkolensis]